MLLRFWPPLALQEAPGTPQDSPRRPKRSNKTTFGVQNGPPRASHQNKNKTRHNKTRQDDTEDRVKAGEEPRPGGMREAIQSAAPCLSGERACLDLRKTSASCKAYWACTSRRGLPTDDHEIHPKLTFATFKKRPRKTKPDTELPGAIWDSFRHEKRCLGRQFSDVHFQGPQA